MTKRITKTTLVGAICVYGNHNVGHGYIADIAGGRMFGDGKPVAGRSATEAVWLAADAIRDALGHSNGLVAVHVDAAGGSPMVAFAPLANVPSFGSLAWQRAEPAVTLSPEDVSRMAEEAS